MNKDKIVVVGAGLGGLSTARLLAQSGYDVTVLEQQSQVGGCLQTFRRGGATFETGMHFIGSAEEGEILHTLFGKLHLTPHISLSRLDTSGYDRISLGNAGEFRFANGHEAFVDTLAAQFPHERESLQRYVGLTASIAAASSIDVTRNDNATISMLTRYAGISMTHMLGELFSDPLLREVMAGTLPLIGARRDMTPFSLHAFIFEFYNRSAFRIVGGSHAIATGLCEGIRSSGGRILTRQRATAILSDSDGATGVRTATGETFPARYVVSAAHPAVTLSLLPAGGVRPAFRQRLLSLPSSPSCFTLYMKFRPGTMPYMNHNFYRYEQPTPWGCEDYRPDNWPLGYLYMHFCHAPSPRFAESGVAISYLRPEETEVWRGTHSGRRGADYETWKRRHAERLLDVMERSIPRLRESISEYYTSTPLTYEDYNGTPLGAMYGTAPDVRLGAAGRVPVKWRLPRLFQAGQCVNSHGILGTLVGTLLTCEEIEKHSRQSSSSFPDIH